MNIIFALILIFIAGFATLFVIKKRLADKYKNDPECRKKVTSSGHILGIWLGSTTMFALIIALFTLIFGSPYPLVW